MVDRALGLVQHLARPSTAHRATLDDGQMLYLLKEEGSRAIHTTARLGSRRPAHCTSLGMSSRATMPPAEALAL